MLGRRDDGSITARTAIYWAATYVLCLGFLAIVGEALVRVSVPPERFWTVTNIYQRAADADVSYTLRPRFAGTAFGVDLHANRLGFRGPEWTVDKPAGTFRVALLGDSHAFGYGVPFEETVGEELARRATHERGRTHEVLSFAVSGYNSVQELAVWRRYVLDFAPDVLVLMPSNNDHEPTATVSGSGYLRRRRTGAGDTMGKRAVATGMAGVHDLLVRSRLYLLTRLVVHERVGAGEGGETMDDDPSWMPEPIPDGPIPAWLRTAVMQPLVQLITEARAHGIPVVLAPFASSPEYRRAFAELAREHRVPLVELLSLFPEARSWRQLLDLFGLGWNPHLNGTAHARWAETLLPTIIPQRDARPAPAVSGIRRYRPTAFS